MFNTVKKLLFKLPAQIAIGLIASYLLFAYFAVDPLAKRLLPWIAEHQLASRASVGQVKFDPLQLTLSVKNLHLTRVDGAPLASFEMLYLDLESNGLLHLAWHIKEVRLTAPQAILDIAPDGKLNWSDLLKKLNEDKEKSDTLPRVVVDHILIEHGDLQYSDRSGSVPFKSALHPLGLELGGLSTLPEDRGDYLLVATLPEQGGTLKWKGDLGVNPIVSSGNIAVKGIQLAHLMQLVPKPAVILSAGVLSSNFSYKFAMVKIADSLKPELALKNIALGIENIQGQLSGAATGTLGLQQITIKLPTLDFNMKQTPQFRLQGMAIDLKDATVLMGNTPLFKMPKAQVSNVDFDLAARKLNVGEILLTDGVVQAKRLGNDSVDWQNLLPAATAESARQKTEQKTETEKPFMFDIASFRLKNWQAGIQDMTFKQPLYLNIKHMDTELALSNADGDLAIQHMNFQCGPTTLKSGTDAKPAASLSKLSLQQGDIRLKSHAIKLEAITLTGLQTQILHQPGKPLNWQTLLEPVLPAHPSTHTSGKKSGQSEWKLGLNRIALDHAAVNIEDSSAASPVVLDIDQAAFELKDATQDLSKLLPLKASFQIRQGGKFDAHGKLALAPLKGDVQLSLHELSLEPFAPYVNQAALLKLDNGTVNSNGKLALHAEPSLSAQFQGGFNVNNLAISEENGGAPFLGWKSLGSDSIKLSFNPNLIHMDELRVIHPVGKVIIYEDKTLNIKRMLRAQLATAPDASSSGESSTPSWPVTVEHVRVDSASLEFADLSLRPQFGTQIHSLTGVINGLSTRPDSTAQVELDGSVDEYGSARIRGAIQPFHATEFTDLTLAFRNLEMNRLTPYSGKFAGRKIDSGKMSIDLEYNIKKHQLAGKNKFVINKLNLGERVDSPEAVNLPLDLAIALLEDSDGVIDLDLPVSGSLDDPQFSYGKVIWKAFVNIIGKIATAPFRALGNLLGISADKLEAVVFDPGSEELAPPEKEKLKAVAQALAKRPGLTLTLVPAYDTVADKKAIQETAVRRDVLQAMGLKVQTSEKPGPIDLNNPKAQATILKLAKESAPEAKNRKWYDKVKDYFDTTKPPSDPAAYQAMLLQLQQQVTVSEAELKTLAETRASSMQQYIEQVAGKGVGHLSLAPPEGISGDGKSVQLKLKLGVGK